MAWGYGRDDMPLGLLIGFGLQALLFLWLFTPNLRRITLRASAWKVVSVALLVVAGQGLLFLASPSFGVGITAGFLTLFVLIPLNLVNGLLFAVRAAAPGGPGARAALFIPWTADVAFWVWRVLAQG